MKKLFFISVVILTSCGPPIPCEESRKPILDESGSFRIERIEGEQHTTALYSKKGARMLFPMNIFTVVPEEGDSIYKEKGTSTYIFVKKDSCYAQDYDCNADFGRGDLLIIKRWKSGDSIDLKKVIR